MRRKFCDVFKTVFGYGIMLTLFSGGLLFGGYLVALAIGGSVAEVICVFMYKKVVPVMIYATTSMVIFGLFSMYLAGEKALSSQKK